MSSAFTCIPNEVGDLLSTGVISQSSFCLYFMTRKHDNKERGCFPGQELLAKELRVSQSTITRSLGELVRAGLITAKRRGNGRTNTYSFPDELPDSSSVSNQTPSDSSPMSNLKKTIKADSSPMSNPDSSPVSNQDSSPVSNLFITNKTKNEQDEELTTNVANATLRADWPASSVCSIQDSHFLTEHTPLVPSPIKSEKKDGPGGGVPVTPYQFVVKFYELLGIDPPKDRSTVSKACHQAKLLMEKGVITDFLPSMIEFCHWADAIDLGVLLSSLEKWRISRLRPAQSDKQLRDSQGRPTARFFAEQAFELERQGL
jgi:hypothetical protein